MDAALSTIRVLIADSTALKRKQILDLLKPLEEVQVVARAKSTQDTIDQSARSAPDLILLGAEAPGAENLNCITEIKQRTGAALILLCPASMVQSHKALTAMRMGADDLISADDLDRDGGAVALQEKLHALVAARRQSAPAAPQAPPDKPLDLKLSQFDLMVVGSSTGGPPILEQIFTAIPEDFPLPIVVAQHMPPLFTKTMSQRLNDLSLIRVEQADKACTLRPGTAHVIVGGKHGRVVRQRRDSLTVEITSEPASAVYRPSVTELFTSAAQACGARTLAIILTGMGEDGLLGARMLHDAGATMIAQDRQSSAIWGMPKVVVKANLANAVLNPDAIGQAIQRAFLRENT